jgi:hypothetical protein
MSVMEKFFSFFGKLMLVLLLLGGAAGGAYYFGRLSVPQPQPGSTEVPAETATPTPQASESGQLITAGLSDASGLSFGIYTVEVPDGWTPVHNQDLVTPTDTLTITNGAYSVKIYQAATGGALCQPSQTFADITTQDGTILRRNDTTTVCQRSPDGSYQQPTAYGHIQYITPPAPATQMLTEMDGILSSLNLE